MNATKAEHYSQNSSLQHSVGVAVLKQYMEWEEGDTVLDAGCGTGDICKFISQQPGVASVLGFDVSPDFVSYASQHNSAANIIYNVANISDVSTIKPEWQGSFSKVISFFVLHWVKDKTAALKALHSCLKPGGEILLILGTDENKSIQTKQRMTANFKWKPYLEDFVPNLFPWPSSDLANQQSHILTECGFEVLSYHLKEHQIVFESREKMRETFRAVYPHLRYIPQDKHEEFLHDVETMARETHLITGDFKITEESRVVRARKL